MVALRLRRARLGLAVGLLAGAVAAMAPAGAQGAASCGKTGVPGGDWPTFGKDAANTRFQEREKVISPADVPLLRPAW